jgi:hypothetical protein
MKLGRVAFALALAASGGAIAQAPAAAIAVPLPNADFEMPIPAGDRCAPGWGCTMHSNPDSFRFYLDEKAPAQGKRSLCIERVLDEPWALATHGTFDAKLHGKRLRLTLWLRTEGVTGQGAGPWMMVHGPSGERISHDEKLVQGTRAWERVTLELDVSPKAAAVEVGATLHGPGKACIDDAVLEIVPPKNPV